MTHIERYRFYAATNFIVVENETDINVNTTTYTDGQLFYFYDSAEDVIKKYSTTTNTLTTTTDYIAREAGVRSASNTGTMPDRRPGLIPVCQTSWMCTCWKEHTTTYSEIWLQDGGVKPEASTSDQLRISYSGTLENLKSLSDQSGLPSSEIQDTVWIKCR